MKFPKNNIANLSIVLFIIFFQVFFYFFTESEMLKVHVLKFPLLFSSNSNNSVTSQYILPAGTTLYYDRTFPEGFTRFKVYFNVEGIKLESQESKSEFPIDPLSAYPVDKENLKILLSEYPLNKEDLRQVLKSSKLNNEDIRVILSEFSVDK